VNCLIVIEQNIDIIILKAIIVLKAINFLIN